MKARPTGIHASKAILTLVSNATQVAKVPAESDP